MRASELRLRGTFLNRTTSDREVLETWPKLPMGQRWDAALIGPAASHSTSNVNARGLPWHQSYVLLQDPIRSRVGTGSGGLAEVTRSASLAECRRPFYGCWYHPARGSGIFVNVGLTMISRKFAMVPFLLRNHSVRACDRSHPSHGGRDGVRCVPALLEGHTHRPNCSALPGWPGFPCEKDGFWAAAGNALGFDSMQMLSGATTHQELLLTRCHDMSCGPFGPPEYASNSSQWHKHRNKTGCVTADTWGGWGGRRSCACAHHELINCAGLRSVR